MAAPLDIYAFNALNALAKWIKAVDTRLFFLITWTVRESIRRTIPFCFRSRNGLRVTAIINVFELFIEKHMHHNTAKYLISITLQGIVSFISNDWGGVV